MSRLQSHCSRYGLAFATTGVAAVLYFLSGPPDVDSDIRYFGFILAILVTALLAGLGPGLLATGLAAFASAYLLLPPIFSIQIASPERTGRLVLFAGEGVLLSFVGNIVRNGEPPAVGGSQVRKYIPALLFVATATGLKLLAYRDLEKAVPFTFYYAAAAASAWAGGFVAGLVAAVLSTVLARYFFIDPPYSLSMHTTVDQVRVAFFLIEAVLLCGLSAKYSVGRRVAADAVALVRDYSQRMRRSAEDIRALRLTSKDVIWEWNPATDRMILGTTESERPQTPAATMTLGAWLRRIHPEDRAYVEASLQSALVQGGEDWACKYRALRSGGTSAHIFDHAYIMRDASGRAVRLVGRRADVTDSKRNAPSSSAGHQRRAVLEQGPLAILLADGGLRVVSANHAATEILGYSPAEFAGLELDRLFEPKQRKSVLNTLLGLNPDGHTTIALDENCLQANGKTFDAKINAASISDVGGGLSGWVVMIESLAGNRGAPNA